MNALLRGEPLPLVNGGNQRRAFMDVSDMNEAVCRVLERPRQSNGQIFNLGNPNNELSIAELARLLALAFAELRPGLPPAQLESVSADAFYGPGYDDTQERMPDIRKAQQLLEWEPQRELAAALPAIVRDYSERYGPRIEAALAQAPFPAARSA
jgi:UDP-apiose/xylose synthase